MRCVFCLLCVVAAAGACDQGEGGPPGDAPTADAWSTTVDLSAPSLEKTPSAGDASLLEQGTPKLDTGTPPTADLGTKPDDAAAPPAYGKICTSSSQCAQGEVCVKLASDGYSRSNPPPPKGLCLKSCTNTNAPCSSSSTHYYPCIGATTWDLGSLKVCAIACYTNLGGGAKTYPCPSGSFCTRSFGTFMKVCTPYP